MKVLVTGATGQFARHVVPALERGIEVRAVVHDPRKADLPRSHGATETIPADLTDRASLDTALDGVDGAFLITPRLSYGTFELAAGGMVDRVELAHLMSRAARTTIIAQDMPTPPVQSPNQPDGLATMFGEYNHHGFHGGNPLGCTSCVHRQIQGARS